MPGSNWAIEPGVGVGTRRAIESAVRSECRSGAIEPLSNRTIESVV